jgi:phosphatidylserine/phosphatidylglycerophosphate/cardiolipin synthase-like enzyme
MSMVRIITGYVFSTIIRHCQANSVQAVSIALDRAKETIYIEDWWLSPELFMRRPAYYNQEWRLDQILKRKAEQGVKIFVIVYREVEVSCSPDIEEIC